ncbi:acanthoscurrin-1-like [Macrobrachium nipponense]|uniref:acanthoscurrin-1-like n=1 Tax=Macrobrachium nipponense TaxID=159736 RepID=UPI0030C835A0
MIPLFSVLLVALVVEDAHGIGLGIGGLGGFGGGFGGAGRLLSAGNYANGFSHSNGYSHGNHILKKFGGAGGLKHGHLNAHLLGKRSADPEPILGLGGLFGGLGGGYGAKGGLLSAGNYAKGFSHSKGYSHGSHIGGGFKKLGGLGGGHLKKFFFGKRSVDQEPESE